ncbi:MAG: Rpn family recombination-promoting nuclease/putative transposase [Synergistaceae bacterium]|nr:Rpn family recombination-promoting nuclease/putative transposase [Synergistaceae bacterium]
MKKISTPYDDAFRTLMNDCVELLIPLINEIFDKNFTGDEQIIQHPNEHFIKQQDGKSQKRITDSSFTIIDSEGNETNFIIEVQSTPDGTMIIRFFEYATQVALDSAVLEENKLTVTIPNASVIFLRSDSSTPDEMLIEIKTPGGNVDFKVPVLKVKNYSLPEIFKKELYFLLPFYIFNLEKDFPVFNKDTNKIKQEYNKFVAGIDKAVEKKKISVYQRRVILDMSKKILENIAKNYKNVRKGVSEIMGGRVLEHEGKTILNEGIAIGEARGKEQGRTDTMNAAIDFMRSNGLSNEQINQFRNFVLNQ